MRRLLVLLTIGLAVLAGSCGRDDGSLPLTVDARINDIDIADADSGNPLRLDPRAESTMALDLTNTSDAAVLVRRVRLEGELLGLNFLTYDVRAELTIEPGETRAVRIPLDFFDLERQASGYLRAFVRAYDSNGDRVSSNEFALDIRGDATATMTLFAIALFLITAVLAALNLRDYRRGQLPEQRFARAMRFMVPGLGLGLLLSMAFSILRIFPLPATSWVPLTLAPAAIGFLIGYTLVPAPGETDPEDDDDLDDLDVLHPDDLVDAVD